MSPFKINLQKFLIVFFAVTSILLVVVGATRSKKSDFAGGTTPPPPLGSQGQAATTPDTTATGTGTAFTGSPYQTPWGNAVASITVANGKITGVTMPTVPQSPPSVYAEPYLVQQAISAGSANIQGVSGATYTSMAFKSSLESAIAKAGTSGQTIAPSTTKAPATSTSKPSVPRRYRDDD